MNGTDKRSVQRTSYLCHLGLIISSEFNTLAPHPANEALELLLDNASKVQLDNPEPLVLEGESDALFKLGELSLLAVALLL